MIIPEAEHWFVAKHPMLEDHEEDEWYRHPTFPLECNKLGIIVFDENVDHVFVPDKNAYRIRTGVLANNIGSRTKLVLECWTGNSYKNCQFIFLDANPLNLTRENLFPTNELPKEQLLLARKKNLKFIQNTLNYMCSRKEKSYLKDVNFDDYYNIMGIPLWLKRYWKKYDCNCRKDIKELNQKAPYNRGAKVDEVMARVEELVRKGLKQKDIAAELGFRHKSLVSYYIKKIEDRQDI